MKKRRRNEHGAITVFLSFVLIFIIAFMGMLVDIARMRVAEAQVKRASQLAIDSVMTSYSRRLREDYGLYGYAGNGNGVNDMFMEYFNANLQPAAEKEHGEFVKLIQTITGRNSVKYGDMLNLSAGENASAIGDYPLTNSEALYQQVVEFSKFRVPITLALTNKLSKVTQMQDALKNINNDTAAYDRMNDLGEPVGEYMKDQSELEEAVETLEIAVNHFQTAVDDWNRLIDGHSGEIITLYTQKGIDYRKYEALKDTIGAPYPDFIYSFRMENEHANVDVNLAAEAYNCADTATAINELWRRLASDIAGKISGKFCNDVEDQRQYLNNLSGNVSEEDQAFLNQLMDAHEAGAKIDAQNAEIDAENEGNRKANEILPDAVQAFQNALQVRTEELLIAYQAAEYAVEIKAGEVRKAINNLEDQGETVQNTAKLIESDLKAQANNKSISEDVYKNWNNPNATNETEKGEKQITEDLLEEDQEKILELKASLDALDDMLEEAKDQNNYESAAVTAEFFQDGVNKRLQGVPVTWNCNDKLMLNIAFGGEYEAKDADQEGKYKTARDEADKYNQKKPNSTGEKEHPPRYNPIGIPEELKTGFVGGAAAEDRDSRSTLENDPRNVSASKVKSASSTQSGGLNDIVNMLGNGLQYIIGTVYTSEYILAMFSNAAPELEATKQGSYNASTFEYNRITTLRNAVPVGYDQVNEYKAEYDNLRTGYFYNAEVEYILFGCDNEYTNVVRTQLLLDVILAASNYLQVRNNGALKAIVNAAATAGMSIGIPSIVTRFLMYTAFAVTETVFDMFYLMRGYEIPALSTKGDLLFMMGKDDKILGNKTELMISYEFYLRLRVMLAVFFDKKATMERMANLIQLNINYEGENSETKFQMKDAFTTFKAKASAKMPYWFMTMAMMGETRSDSKWFEIPEHEIVASY